jgi:NADPH2:quinone reductase
VPQLLVFATSLRAFNLGAFFGLRPQAAIAALQTLIGYVASGQVKVNVGHLLPLSQAAEAHHLPETRASVGKIILKPWA